MDNVLKESRVRFSGIGEETEDERPDTGEGRLPLQKKVSFKEERKKTQDRFQGQFSGQMSNVDDASDGEFETAIAAAAYAITLLEEESLLNQKKSDEESDSALTKTTSKREESLNKPTDSSKISRWFSGKEEKDGKSPVSGGSSIRKSGTLDLKDSAANHKVAEKEMHTTPTIKKTPTFSDKNLNATGSKNFGHRQDQGGQQEPSMIKSRASFSEKGNGGWKTASSNTEEAKADAWEKAKMARIKQRYEKANATIQEWENEKKAKAKRRLDRTERGSERARAIQEYRNEMARIDKIVATARALEEERKRNDEYKVMEKARKIRLTGKLPHTCPCL